MSNVGKKIVQYYCEYCGKSIYLKNDELYTFNKKYFHMDCLITKLKRARKHKYTPDEIEIILKESREKGKTTVNNGKGKSGKKSNPSVKLPKINSAESEDLNFLLDFLDKKYHFTRADISFIKKSLISLNNGTYKKANGEKISSEKLYNMFTYYEQTIDKAHARLKNPITNSRSLFYYDLTIIISKYDEYDLIRNSSLKNDDTIHDFEVSNYFVGRNIDTEEEDDDIDFDAFLEGY